jgi:hypothetical protein
MCTRGVLPTMLKIFATLIIIIYPVTQDLRTLLSALLAFSGMSHDLRHNSLAARTPLFTRNANRL